MVTSQIPTHKLYQTLRSLIWKTYWIFYQPAIFVIEVARKQDEWRPPRQNAVYSKHYAYPIWIWTMATATVRTAAEWIRIFHSNRHNLIPLIFPLLFWFFFFVYIFKIYIKTTFIYFVKFFFEFFLYTYNGQVAWKYVKLT